MIRAFAQTRKTTGVRRGYAVPRIWLGSFLPTHEGAQWLCATLPVSALDLLEGRALPAAIIGLRRSPDRLRLAVLISAARAFHDPARALPRRTLIGGVSDDAPTPEGLANKLGKV